MPRAEDTGIVAELRLHDTHVTPSREGLVGYHAGRTLHKEAGRLADTSSDDDELRVERG